VYRTKEEIEEWMKKDPIDKLKKQLVEAGMLTEKAIEEMNREILDELDKAVKFALESPLPKPEETLEYVYG
jgi:pyruvate dehydrogenase E1 component alpha subunit